MTDVIREIALLLMVVLLPGFMLILSVFPKRSLMEGDLDTVFKLLLGMISSLLIAIGIAVLLSFSEIVTGKTILDSDELLLILSILTLLFAVIAWARGGLSNYIDAVSSIRSGGAEPRDLLSLATRKRELQAKLYELESYRNSKEPALKEEVAVRSEKLLQEIEEINVRIDAMLAESPVGAVEGTDRQRG